MIILPVLVAVAGMYVFSNIPPRVIAENNGLGDVNHHPLDSRTAMCRADALQNACADTRRNWGG